MNQHINKLDIVSRLQVEQETIARVHSNRVFRMPRFVRQPGSSRLIDTHRVRSNHRSQLILTK